jgi:protein TonB
MSYVDQGMSKGRVWAIVLVFVLHALLGYAFVTGLAYKYVKSIQEDLKTFDVIDEPPPPPEEPPPPEQKQVQPPPVVTPPPLVRTNVPPPPAPVTTVRVAPPPVITPTAPPAPPAPPPPPRTVEPARARANLASYVSNDDYPSAAIRNGEQGTTGFELTVGSNGRVTDCTITSSSGSSTLDAATCRLMRSRARFTPARDNQGNPTTDTVSSRIRWVLPD